MLRLRHWVWTGDDEALNMLARAYVHAASVTHWRKSEQDCSSVYYDEGWCVKGILFVYQFKYRRYSEVYFKDKLKWLDIYKRNIQIWPISERLWALHLYHFVSEEFFTVFLEDKVSKI